MSALSESTIRVWSAPTRPTRRYRTKHAAFIGWAKDLIRKHGEGCACSNGYDDGFRESAAPYVCPWHRSLYEAPAWACEACGSPDEKRGSACSSCEYPGARCTIATTLPSSSRYMRLRNRLARWLRWAEAR